MGSASPASRRSRRAVADHSHAKQRIAEVELRGRSLGVVVTVVLDADRQRAAKQLDGLVVLTGRDQHETEVLERGRDPNVALAVACDVVREQLAAARRRDDLRLVVRAHGPRAPGSRDRQQARRPRCTAITAKLRDRTCMARCEIGCGGLNSPSPAWLRRGSARQPAPPAWALRPCAASRAPGCCHQASTPAASAPADA